MWAVWVLAVMLVVGVPLAFHLGQIVGAEQEIDRRAVEREKRLRERECDPPV